MKQKIHVGEFHPITQNGGHIPDAINLAVGLEVDADGVFMIRRVPTVLEGGMFKMHQELVALFDLSNIDLFLRCWNEQRR